MKASRLFIVLIHLSFLGNLLHCGGNDNSSQDSLFALLAFNQFGLSNPGSQVNCPPPILPEDVYRADTVVIAPGSSSSRPFGNPANAITGVCGGGEFSGSLHVYELQSSLPGGQIVLSWTGGNVQNESGIDFIVFENAFRNQGASNSYFVEPVIVEVSIDNTNYCGFNPNFRGVVPGGGSLDSATQVRDDWRSMAGLSPVLYNMSTNPIPAGELFNSPVKQSSGNTHYMGISGGDGFDLDHITNTGYRTSGSGTCDPNLVTSIKTNGFRYLKLTSAEAVGFPKPIGVFRESSDIDGVIARRLQN